MIPVRVLLVFPASLYRRPLGGRPARQAGAREPVLRAQARGPHGRRPRSGGGARQPRRRRGARHLPRQGRGTPARAPRGPRRRLVLVGAAVLGRRGGRRARAPASSGGRHRRRGVPRLGAPRRLRLRGRALRLARRRRGRERRGRARAGGRRRRPRHDELPLARGHAAAARRRSPARLRRLSVRRRGAARARALPEPGLPLQRARLSAAPGRRRLARLPGRDRPAAARRGGGAQAGAHRPPRPGLRLRRDVAARGPRPHRRRATGATSPSRSTAGRDALVRLDLDKMYAARVRLRLDVGTLSRELLSRTGQAPQPQRAVEHALDLLALRQRQGPRDRGLVHLQPARRDRGDRGRDTRRTRACSWTRRRTRR